ncbi:MAG TPA: ribosome maturation factor RimM [Chthonomonadales bacterium]|nr:ribosome maturation factor RimM [Chthonomonadales bacterium]
MTGPASVPDPPAEWDWTIGVVVAPFGIAGEMKVRILTDFPERFETLAEACLQIEGGRAQRVRVTRTRMHKGHVLLRVDGVETADDAAAWRGARVQVRREDAPPLGTDEHYDADLIGLAVVTVDGRTVGPVEQVLHYPAQDLLRVGDALIPAVRPIVREVDVAGGRIVIDPPEGLLPGESAVHAD